MGRRKTGKIPGKERKREVFPKEGKYMGVDYESYCELACLFFAEELMEKGYVEMVRRSPSYLLCEPVHNTYVVKMKKGSKQKTQTIINGASYTPDYDIYFTPKALGKFCWELGSSTRWEKNLLVSQKTEQDGRTLYRACVEVKPDFSRNSTTPKSVQSMKWLMQRYGVFVNLFRPNRIFRSLFVPRKYLFNERGNPRKLKFSVRSLSEYLNSLK